MSTKVKQDADRSFVFFVDPLVVTRFVGEATRKLREAMPTCRWGCGPIVFSTSTAAILKPLGITMRKYFSQFSRDPRHNVSVKEGRSCLYFGMRIL